MLDWDKELEKTLEISKYSDGNSSKFVIYNYFIDGKIEGIVEKHLESLYLEAEKELNIIKETLKKLCEENNGLIYYDEERKIINNKIHYLSNDGKVYKQVLYEEGNFEFEEEGNFEFELEILKEAIEEKKQ